MDEEMMDYDDASDNVEPDYETWTGQQRNDVRRKIEEILERKRLREEFGDLEY